MVAFLATAPFSAVEAAPEKPSDIPVEAFASLEIFTSPKLSPSGNSVAYLTSEKGQRLLIVHSLTGGPTYSIPPQEDSDIRTFNWVNEEVILMTTSSERKRAEFVGTVPEARLMAYNLKTHKVRWLGKPEKVGIGKSNLPQRTPQIERIVDMLPNEPERVLIAMDFELDGKTEVYRTNVYSGRRRFDKSGNDGVQLWFSDQTGEVRLGVGHKTQGFGNKGEPYAIVKNAEGKWKDLDNADWYADYDVRTFTADPDIIYVSGNNEFGTTGLYTLSLSKGEITGKIFEQEDADFTYLITESKTKKVIGVGYKDTSDHVKYFDEFYAGFQSNLQNAFAGSRTSIVGKASNAERYIVRVRNSQNPGTYYLYDRAEGQLSALSNVRDDMPAPLMADVNSVIIPMRDEFKIEAFITKPVGWKKGDETPFIILPHGGPRGHDNANWDWWTQFYASRGYGVLQPNFRGSTGYGDAFEDAGIMQWGGLMQDDVTDATKWLVSEGLAAADRICIVGASYGGYAALIGAVKEPALYKCAVSVNGVANLPSMKDTDKRFIGGRSWIDDMGLEGQSDENVSPYHQAKSINIPVLLIAAKDDARVNFNQSKDMHKRLKKLKKQSKLVILKNGGHSMKNAAVRLKMLKATEKFLAEHIGH